MDKKICPECQKEIPADAKVCPSCACFFDNMDKQPPSSIQDDDDTKICPLTDNDATKKKKTYIALAGVCCIVVGFLLLEVVAIGSILLLGVGLYLLFYSSTINTDIQRGLCPYCRKELVVKQKQIQISFFCPSCKKLVVQTPTTLEAIEETPKETAAATEAVKPSQDDSELIYREPRITLEVEFRRDNRTYKPWASDIDLQQVCDQFAALGWDLWDSSIHYAQGQADRVKRGRTEGIVLIWYNQRTGYAKVKNARGRYYLVSRAGCSCPDFRDRGLPCKHMYFLAFCLPDFGDKLVPDLVQKPPAGSESLLLYDLQFCLCGRGQDPIKEFLTLHGSRFGPYSWHDTDAVIVTDPTLRTATVTKAEEQNVAVISFDELKEMVCFEREEVAEVAAVDLENCGQVDG